MVVVTKPLAGKIALVTGGANRLGRASALALAAAGADIAITYLNSVKEARRTVKELEASGVRVLAIRCDVTDPKSVRAAVRETAKKLGGVDILVNNAGAYETVAFEDLTLQQWDDIFAVNVRGPFLLSQAALPYLRRRKGRIINLGSLGGLRAWATHAHYCSSKAALHMLTKSMAKALAPQIVVNCVAPGMISRRISACMRARASSFIPMTTSSSPPTISRVGAVTNGSASPARSGRHSSTVAPSARRDCPRSCRGRMPPRPRRRVGAVSRRASAWSSRD